MKKFFATMMAVAILMFAAQAEAISREDSTFAFQTVTQKLNWWKCTPLKIWYGGDELNNAENVAYMNELAESRGCHKKFTACMVFYSDFIAPPDPHDGKISAWRYDSEYKNWSWYFGLYEDGEWKLLTWGF